MWRQGLHACLQSGSTGCLCKQWRWARRDAAFFLTVFYRGHRAFFGWLIDLADRGLFNTVHQHGPCTRRMNEIRESMTCLMSQRACSPPVIVTSRCHICTMAKNAVSCASVAKSVRSLTCNLKILFAWLIIFLASLSVVSYTFFNPLQVANKNRISPDRPLAVHRNLSALPTSREGVIVSR